MSLLQTAFVEKSRVPDREQLEEAVHALGFDLSIDEFYQPFDCSGFLPGILKGKKSGFEIYFDSPEEAFKSFPHLKEQAENRDCAITSRWSGDMAECACVLIVSAALATSFAAVVHYQADDLVYPADRLVHEVRQGVGYAEAAELDALLPRPQKKPWWRLW